MITVLVIAFFSNVIADGRRVHRRQHDGPVTTATSIKAITLSNV